MYVIYSGNKYGELHSDAQGYSRLEMIDKLSAASEVYFIYYFDFRCAFGAFRGESCSEDNGDVFVDAILIFVWVGWVLTMFLLLEIRGITNSIKLKN